MSVSIWFGQIPFRPTNLRSNDINRSTPPSANSIPSSMKSAFFADDRLHSQAELLLEALGACGRNCDSPRAGQTSHPAQVEATRGKGRTERAGEVWFLFAPIE